MLSVLRMNQSEEYMCGAATLLISFEYSLHGDLNFSNEQTVNLYGYDTRDTA